jgi:transcriptional regulator GlxA family with amidase domain
MFADVLAERFPAVEVDRSVLYVEDDGVFTAAGTAAGVDLCLHLVRQDLGVDAANLVARRMVVPPHRDGGQAQFIAAPVPTPTDGEQPLAPLLDWMVEHLDDALTVTDLADRAGLSERTFARRFTAATGSTPLRWLLAQRVAHARLLLESTDLPVEQVAGQCGFATAAGLRLHFQRQVGTSPLAYRRTFRQVAG